MKRLTLTLLALILTSIAYSQDSFYITKRVDAMSDKVYYAPNQGIIVANPEQTMAFRLDMFFGHKLEFRMITATIVGIGSCHEADGLIILFENGEKLKSVAWNKFNCDGDAYFYVTKEGLALLKTQPMKTIRITNGYTYDSYTGDVDESDKNYFIKLFYELSLGRYILIK